MFLNEHAVIITFYVYGCMKLKIEVCDNDHNQDTEQVLTPQKGPFCYPFVSLPPTPTSLEPGNY